MKSKQRSTEVIPFFLFACSIFMDHGREPYNPNPGEFGRGRRRHPCRSIEVYYIVRPLFGASATLKPPWVRIISLSSVSFEIRVVARFVYLELVICKQRQNFLLFFLWKTQKVFQRVSSQKVFIQFARIISQNVERDLVACV